MNMSSVDLSATRTFTSDEAQTMATELGIDSRALGRDLGRWGLLPEVEHGPGNTEADVSGDDPSVTGTQGSGT